MKNLKMALDDLIERLGLIPAQTQDELDEVTLSVARDHHVDERALTAALRAELVGI